MEVELLKDALRDEVRKREINHNIVVEQNTRILELLAERKALNWMIQILLRWLGN